MIRFLGLLVTMLVLTAPSARAADVSYAGRVDVAAPDGVLSRAADAAVDADGNVYVLFGPYVRKYDAAGALLGTWGGLGDGAGQFRVAQGQFEPTGPLGLDVDAGRVVVADTAGDRLVVFDRDGRFLANWGEGRLDAPAEVVVDHTGAAIVASGITTTSQSVVRLGTDGSTVARWESTQSIESLAVGTEGTVYVRAGGERVDRLDPVSFAPLAPFDLLPPFPASRGKTGSPYPCCGVAVLAGSVWVGRSHLGRLERYGTDGAFRASCELVAGDVPALVGGDAFSGLADKLVAGRDGNLYVLRRGTVDAQLLRLRVDDPAAPACTERPRAAPPAPAGPGIRWARLKDGDRTVSLTRRRALGRLRLVYKLPRAARLTISIRRAVPGRLVDGRCRPARAGNRNGRCMAFVRRAAVTLPEATGRTRHEYRLVSALRPRAWRRGHYELALTAVDAAGRRSSTTSLTLRVLR